MNVKCNLKVTHALIMAVVIGGCKRASEDTIGRSDFTVEAFWSGAVTHQSARIVARFCWCRKSVYSEIKQITLRFRLQEF
jgi:hypothetical protein